MRAVAFLVACLCLSAVALAGAAGPRQRTVTVDGIEILPGEKLPTIQPVEITDLTLYQGTVVLGNEKCIIVSGYVTSNLPAHSKYEVEVTVYFWASYAPTEMQPLKTKVQCPEPKKRTRFIVAGPGDHGKNSHTYGLTATYTIAEVRPKPTSVFKPAH